MSDPPPATDAARAMVDPIGSRAGGSALAMRLRANLEYIAIPLLALAIAAGLFAIILMAIGKSPVDFVCYVRRGGFGTAFSFQNTLQRSAPLIMTALAVAIPARIAASRRIALAIPMMVACRRCRRSLSWRLVR